MIKIVDSKGKTLFVVNDIATEPTPVIEDEAFKEEDKENQEKETKEENK